MRLLTLGGLSLDSGEFGRPKPLLLLAYLALEGSKEKRHLYELFWPDALDPANSLRSVGKQLRTVSAELLLTDEHTASIKIESDIADLQQAITSQDAEKVAELYRGAFLHGFSLAGWSAELEEWVYSTRDFFASRVRVVFTQRAEVFASRGDFDQARQWAERAYELSQTFELEDLERLYPLLTACKSGLSVEIRKRAVEYGLELQLSLEEARRRYCENSPADGEQQSLPHNLPRSKTSFIGRDLELVELGEMIGPGEAQLITLLGPGGIGKTRLALQLAFGQVRANGFPGGIYFVPLEALNGPEQLPMAIAQALEINLKHDPFAAIKARIAYKRMLLVLDNFEHLMEEALLVSELLEACPYLTIVITSRERLSLQEETAVLLEGLPVPDKGTLDLAMVEYNDAVRLFVQRAKRARREFALTQETLPHVLDICNFVAGSPLGIELAAVWLRSMPISVLARDIGAVMTGLKTPFRNVAQRHHSLMAVFEHSWQLLTPKEQITLARLTVFVDGFSREAAGQVCDATIPLLSTLVDKSLLRLSPEGRFDFHPLLHQYAREKLAYSTDEETKTRANHANYFLTLVEASIGAGEQAQVQCCKNEHQNLLATLAWSRECNETLVGLKVGLALTRFWETQGYISEGRHWLSIVLAHSGSAKLTELRVKVLYQAGQYAFMQAEYALAQKYLEEMLDISLTLNLGESIVKALLALSSVGGGRGDAVGAQQHAEKALTLARAHGDDWLVVYALDHLACAAADRADYATFLPLAEDCLALFRKAGNSFHVAGALNNLGFYRWLTGDLLASKYELEEAITLAQLLPDLPTVCLARSNLGGVMHDLGDMPSAQLLARQALEFRWSQSDWWGLTYSLENIANLAVDRGDPSRAAHLWGAAEGLRLKIDSPMPPIWRGRHERFVAQAKSHLNEATFRARWQEGIRGELEEAVKAALELTNLAPTNKG